MTQNAIHKIVYCSIFLNPYLQQGGANRLNQRTFLTSHL